MNQNRLALLALHAIPGIGDVTLRQLISYAGNAENVFKTPKGKLLKIPGIGRITAEAIRTGNTFKQAEKELTKAEKDDVQILLFTDTNYPSRLKQVPDAPCILYVKGNVDFENPKTVGIVGTRKATDYGRNCVEDLIIGLKEHKPLIVSGLAYGIDIQAHKQAVKHNLPTIGVMGSGVDVIYPPAHQETAKKMLHLGGLVTENSFGTKPDAHNFPARNRIIAALSDALIVVEAAEKGGALITADISNSYNKDVFAFPGNIGQSYSTGCNNLIKSNKAYMITDVKDLEYLMNWDLNEPTKKNHFNIGEDFSDEERSIVQILQSNNNQLMIDELGWRSNINISKLASILLTLEFKGIVNALPGKIYKLKL
ncbi:DNA-processing protein DprA [Pseudochryseolinea flava]|uniref:DNA-protecting protein DprA n=1 Tax=Pseudochryseolinea flava TaxID=2059302 RepID=A0A364XUJ8_9BACT|nr:DNA-processing protein DprA [Pseudochryseolinea flava]RAV97938.1 DNA-protecting protein DprA [Pseudochryseolinea flava]